VKRVRDERGLSLVELLIGMTLALVVLAASFAAFDSFYRSANDNDARFDTAEVARGAVDRQTRQLRNLGKRLNNTTVIDTAAGYDLIFQTSDPQRTWVRYCLDTTTPPASASRGRLWESQLALPAAAVGYVVTAAMRAACPGSGWTTSSVVADHVTNRAGGLDRALFSYTCTDAGVSCTTAATYDQIVDVTTQTIVDTTPAGGPPELRLESGVHLRNQNQAPAVSFVATPTQSRTVLLNASGSVDHEGRTLALYWFAGTMPTAITCDDVTVTVNVAGDRILWGGVLIGDGITLSHRFLSGLVGSTVSIGLVGCDPGDRFGTAGVAAGAAIPVAIPN
jgi:type II secretory pathway component PulJ